MTEIFGHEWRKMHAAVGDDALARAARALVPVDDRSPGVGEAQAWALIAQAHYAAANVRARPMVK